MTTYSGKLYIRFIVSAFHKLPSIYVFSYFPFGFEGRKSDCTSSWSLLIFFTFPNRLLVDVGLPFAKMHCTLMAQAFNDEIL